MQQKTRTTVLNLFWSLPNFPWGTDCSFELIYSAFKIEDLLDLDIVNVFTIMKSVMSS